jgi:hypothetical protein
MTIDPLNFYSFDSTGVAIIRGAIDPLKVQEAVTLLQKNWPKGTPWKFPVLHLGRVFWEFMTHPDLLRLSEQFAGEHFRMDHAFGVSSNGATAQLHGGPQSSQYSCFYQTLPSGDRIGLAGQLNFGFALNGQTPETGGFCYIPGSHKSADPRAGKEVLAEVYNNKFDHHSIVVPVLKPGDMLLFTEGLIHGDTGWRAKGSQRTQIYYKMTPGFMCWRDPAQSEHLKQYAKTPLERRLIEPPWTGRYSEDEVSMGFNNERRLPTRQV